MRVEGAVLNDALLCARYIGIPDRLVLGPRKKGSHVLAHEPYMLTCAEVEPYYLNTVAGVTCVGEEPRATLPRDSVPDPRPVPRPRKRFAHS